MIVDLVLLILGLIGLAVATKFDIRTTEIPDWISYSLIISGLSLRALNYLAYGNSEYIIYALITLLISFFIGNIMYYTKQWGGGDAKLLMATSVVFATYPEFLLRVFSPSINKIYFPIVIFLNILIIGIVYSISYALYLSIKHKDDLIREWNLYLSHTQKTRKIVFVLSILLIILAIIVQSKTLKINLFIISVAMPSLLYIWMYIKSVEKSCMYKQVPISRLLEGDWLTKDTYHNQKLILKKPVYGLTKNHIEILREYNIKKVEIKQGIVFGPVFLIAVILSLIAGNLLDYIVKESFFQVF